MAGRRQQPPTQRLHRAALARLAHHRQRGLGAPTTNSLTGDDDGVDNLVVVGVVHGQDVEPATPDVRGLRWRTGSRGHLRAPRDDDHAGRHVLAEVRYDAGLLPRRHTDGHCQEATLYAASSCVSLSSSTTAVRNDMCGGPRAQQQPARPVEDRAAPIVAIHDHVRHVARSQQERVERQ